MEKKDLKDVVYFFGMQNQIDNKGLMNCPVCKRKKKVQLNYDKNVFNCAACGDFHGGVLDFWMFYRNLQGTDYKEVCKDLYNAFKTSDNTHIYIQPEKEEKKNICRMAGIKFRDRTYRRVLGELKLSDKHRKDLHKRGLSDEEIRNLQYRSLPENNEFINKLIKEGFVIEGVPGFYQDEKNSSWKFGYKSKGFLIPQKNSKGMIQGFQIRLDEGKPKYISLSSNNKEKGTPSKAFVHYANTRKEDVKRSVILTEGPMKADIINAYTGIPVIAIPGVNSQSQLKIALTEMKKKGLEDVYIAFDMDLLTNDNVKRGLKKLEKLLSEEQLNYLMLYWDEDFKGLDDFLLGKYQTKKLKIKESVSLIRSLSKKVNIMEKEESL